MKLLTIQDLQASLDDAVKAMQINDLISGFVTYMLERPDLWLAEDESKISRGVSNYFLDQLHYFTHRTMNDYLKIKFDTTDPSTIAKKVRDDILLPLAQKAEPLFWTDNALYSIAEAGKLGYCSIPEESQEIDRAAQDYHTAETTVSIRPSYSSDRISFLMFRCGIPMFAYKGTDNYRGAKPLSALTCTKLLWAIPETGESSLISPPTAAAATVSLPTNFAADPTLWKQLPRKASVKSSSWAPIPISS